MLTAAAVDFAALRAREFARLDAGGHAYLDHTGAALYPECLVAAHTSMLRESILGNPHAENPASRASSAWIASARRRVLEFLDADEGEYAVIFTANATAALGLVASGFHFAQDAPFVLSADNHNSVNGIREFAVRAGAPVHYLALDAELRLDAPRDALATLSGGGLFAFPAQSNFSGVKHPLSLVRHARALGYTVLLDAAAFVPTSRLSLREVPADFVALSFYKLFGYPTGIGALVARRESLAALQRPWFSGGTVRFASVQNRMHELLGSEEAFEDGTANYLGIAAVAAGLGFLLDLDVEEIGRHANELTLRLIEAFASLTHRRGAPLVRVYGPADGRDRGATVAFNVLSASGEAVPFAQVESRARAAMVSVRGGCFCNPGASEAAFGFPAAAAGRCLESASSEGWTLERFGACMRGYPVGAVRASFGLSSNVADLERLVAVVESFAS